MEYSNQRYAVVSRPSPTSALYFENAFALHGGVYGMMSGIADIFTPQDSGRIPDFIVNSESKLGVTVDRNVILKKAIDIVKANFRNVEQHQKLFSLVEETINQYALDQYGQRNAIIEEFLNEYIKSTSQHINAHAFLDNLFIASTTARLRHANCYAVPVFENVQNPDWMGGDNLEEGIELALLDMPLIDGETCSWEQAGEVRSDPDSKRQLRNFRLFLDDIDINKGKSFIQDSLLQRIEEYEMAASKHGFRLLKNTVQAFFNKNTLYRVLTTGLSNLFSSSNKSAGSMMDVICGTDLYGAMSDLGSLSLSLKEAKMTRNLGVSQSGPEYLITVKNKIQGR